MEENVTANAIMDYFQSIQHTLEPFPSNLDEMVVQKELSAIENECSNMDLLTCTATNKNSNSDMKCQKKHVQIRSDSTMRSNNMVRWLCTGKYRPNLGLGPLQKLFEITDSRANDNNMNIPGSQQQQNFNLNQLNPELETVDNASHYKRQYSDDSVCFYPNSNQFPVFPEPADNELNEMIWPFNTEYQDTMFYGYDQNILVNKFDPNSSTSSTDNKPIEDNEFCYDFKNRSESSSEQVYTGNRQLIDFDFYCNHYNSQNSSINNNLNCINHSH